MHLCWTALDKMEAVMAGVVRGWDSSSFYLRDEGGLKVECGPWQADRGSHLCSGEGGDVWSLFRLRPILASLLVQIW